MIKKRNKIFVIKIKNDPLINIFIFLSLFFCVIYSRAVKLLKQFLYLYRSGRNV